MKNNRWQIILKNSIDGSQFIKPIRREFRTNLEVNEASLEIIERRKPITLMKIIMVIPPNLIHSVSLDTRRDRPQLNMACGIKMTSTKGSLFEVEFNGEYDFQTQILEFDAHVRMLEASQT